MPFQKGHKFSKGGARPGAGRKPSQTTQRKRFLEKYPDAFEKLLEAEYKKGLQGNSDSAQYVMDRIAGRPHQSIDQRTKLTLDLTGDDLALAIEEAMQEEALLLGPGGTKPLPRLENALDLDYSELE